MVPEQTENQLELFDAASQSTGRPSRLPTGPLRVVLRHDQFLLVSIGIVIGLTVIFAFGVERGKELVRSERAFLPRPQQLPVVQGPAATTAEPVTSGSGAPVASAVKGEGSEKRSAPAAPKAPKEPTKLAAGKGHYAIQVVSYSRPMLAKQEMDRLRSRGERAFLVMRDGRTTVYVGPFPSKGNASQRLTMLKPRYQDCFVRSL